VSTCFFGGAVPIARFDIQTHPIFEKLTTQQLGYMWRETEVDITKDKADFRNLSFAEQHIFTSNLKRQILLDTFQGRSPSLALLPLASLPEVENWIQTWTFFETIHSRSYTHIIRNVYSDPSVVFDGMLDIKEIVDCGKNIGHYYDDLINYTRLYNEHGEGYVESMFYEYGNSPVEREHEISLYQLKKKLWLCLMAINVLEGVRFYASFACSWAFAEQKASMEGNAKIIKLICRDENLHLAAVQHMMKILPKEDTDFAKISEECKDEAVAIFEEAVEQERQWADFLFQHGSMIGLNRDMLVRFVEERAAKLMKQAKLPTTYESGNSLPWTQKWISGADVQVAPQETELSSYTTGAVKQDVVADTFAGFSF
jgi:ribonucleoside-diphosphate reductase beta chain